MKSLLVLLALFGMTQKTFAQSSLNNQEELVTETNLTLVGKGISARKSTDSLAVACIEKNEDQATALENPCKFYRFVRFKDSTSAVYIGKPFQGSLKQINHSLKSWVKETTSPWNRTAPWVAAGIVGSALAVPIIGFIPVGALVGLTMGSMLSTNDFYLFSASFISGTVSGDRSDQSLTNQKGWSWSVSPRKISKSNYHKLIESLYREEFYVL